MTTMGLRDTEAMRGRSTPGSSGAGLGRLCAGLLGGDTAPYHTARSMAFRASGGGDQPGTPALTGGS